MRFLPRPQPTVREEARSTHSVLLSVSLGRTRYFSSHLVGRVGLMRGKLGNVLGFMATCPGEPLLCEKAGSRQPSTLSDDDHVRPASATPRHRASFPLLSRLRDPNTGAFLHPNGEGAADPGRGLTADGDEGLLHLSFCSVPHHSAPLPTHHPCMPAPRSPPTSFQCILVGGVVTAPDPLLQPTAGNTGASWGQSCLQGFSQPPPNSLFSSASHRPKGVGSQGIEAVLAFAQPPYCPPICATLLAQWPATLGRQVSSVSRASSRRQEASRHLKHKPTCQPQSMQSSTARIPGGPSGTGPQGQAAPASPDVMDTLLTHVKPRELADTMGHTHNDYRQTPPAPALACKFTWRNAPLETNVY